MQRGRLALLILWLAAGIAMVITGIFVLFNRDKTISAISNLLGVCSLAAGIIVVAVRIFQMKILGRRSFSLDFLIWFIAAFMLFNTRLLNKMGKATFIILGFFILAEGIRSIAAAFTLRNEKSWFVPRLIFSIIFMLLGIVVIFNAEHIFTSMIVLSVGIFFIVHGFSIINEWLVRVCEEYRQ